MLNDKGFTFLEALVAFSLVLLIASSFFPLMFRMISNLNEGKKELAAYRFLYEYGERHTAHGYALPEERVWKNIYYEIFLDKDSSVICIKYEEKQVCANE